MAYKSGFFSQFSRKLSLLDVLTAKRHPVAIAELAEELGVSEKTIRRDLHDISESGRNLTYSYDADNDGRTQVQLQSRTFINVALTRSEAHWLAATRRLWSPFKGTSFHEAMEKVIGKILENVPVEDRAEIEADTARFLFVPTGGLRDYEPKREIVRTLQKAVTRRRRVTYTYRTPQGKRLSGTMEPMAFVIYSNTIYVFARRLPSARAAKNGDSVGLQWVRWPADRFQKAELTGEVFEVPRDFRIEDHFDGFGIISDETKHKVVVDFDGVVAPYIAERIWPGTVTMTATDDGGLRLVLATANLVEVQNWIQSHAGHAVVQEPFALRDAIIANFERALALGRQAPQTERPAPGSECEHGTGSSTP